MKTAISVPDEVFEQAERAAKRLGMSRSELFTRAVQAFLTTRAEENITKSYDSAFSDIPESKVAESKVDAFRHEVTRRALLEVEWE